MLIPPWVITRYETTRNRRLHRRKPCDWEDVAHLVEWSYTTMYPGSLRAIEALQLSTTLVPYSFPRGLAGTSLSLGSTTRLRHS